MPGWSSVEIIVAEEAAKVLSHYVEEGRKIPRSQPYDDVVAIVQWHQRGRKNAEGKMVLDYEWSYGNGVGIDSLAKLETNNHPRQIVVRDANPPFVIWAGPDIEPPGTFVLDWVDGKFSISKRD